MNKHEAVAAMRAGQKVTHRFSTPGQWMCIKDDKIITEDGCEFGWDLFWNERIIPAWDDGYSLVTEFNHQAESKK